ncbi:MULTISPECIES: MerR family transcriptional regulator [Actinoplanes]|uniref:MerR family transcriptional regulator n=1 Tax=Actinoplanes TaxID=1865 RepID=UPI000AA72C51|nr:MULTISPECIES: MerR family transcriptional regulator [Actinoplanes]GLY04656.1 MerR family transcriptional regulator [Actinoplanes sp. NBRC 101535]
MTIGDFSRRTGLSVKALRIYETTGLLVPASVSPASNYRWYHPDQLVLAHRIGHLRRLGMPLTVIAEIVNRPEPEFVGRLDRWWAGEQEAMAARQHSYTWLRSLLAHGSEPEFQHEVHTRLQPQRKVATMRAETDQDGLVPAINTLEWAIRDTLDEQHAVTTGEHWVIYHGIVTPESTGSIEVCVPFTGPVEPTGRVTIRIEPERLVAYTEVSRDDTFHPRIMRAYQAVEEHVVGAGMFRSAPVREIYLDFWERLSGTDPFVHVAQPFEG